MKKKSYEGNDVKDIHFFHMKFKTLLFSKQKIDLMTWLTNIMNTLIQVKAKFWRLKKNLKFKFDQNVYKPNLPVLNFVEKLLLTNWF